MGKRYLSLVASFSLFISAYGETFMYVEQENGNTLEFQVDDVRRVYFKNKILDDVDTTNLLIMPGYLNSKVKATSSSNMDSILLNATNEVNKIDPNHKYLRVAVISDLHSVPSDAQSQSNSLYKGTSCNDNIVLFGNVMEQLSCDAGFALGDYSDNRIAYSNKNTMIDGGIDKYQEETKSVLNKLRNSHTKPMFFTMGNHEFGDVLKGQIFDANMCNTIIQTCNRPSSSCSVKYLNGTGYAYSVSFNRYKVKIAVNCDGPGINNGWPLAEDIYFQTPATWTVGCFTHGSNNEPLNGRHDGVITKHYTLADNNLKSFGVVRGHVHDSGNVGFDYLTISEKEHYFVCPRMSLPASYYREGTESDNDHFCVSVFIFNTDLNKTFVVRLGRANWEKYVESKTPDFPYSYDFITDDK